MIIHCPRCRESKEGHPALSRHDNHTEICSECGELEAFEDAGMMPPYEGGRYWLTGAALVRASERKLYGDDLMDSFDLDQELNDHNWGLN